MPDTQAALEGGASRVWSSGLWSAVVCISRRLQPDRFVGAGAVDASRPVPAAGKKSMAANVAGLKAAETAIASAGGTTSSAPAPPLPAGCRVMSIGFFVKCGERPPMSELGRVHDTRPRCVPVGARTTRTWFGCETATCIRGSQA